MSCLVHIPSLHICLGNARKRKFFGIVPFCTGIFEEKIESKTISNWCARNSSLLFASEKRLIQAAERRCPNFEHLSPCTPASNLLAPPLSLFHLLSFTTPLSKFHPYALYLSLTLSLSAMLPPALSIPQFFFPADAIPERFGKRDVTVGMVFTDFTAESLKDIVGIDQNFVVEYGVASVFTVQIGQNNPSGATFVAKIANVTLTNSGKSAEDLPGFGTLQVLVEANASKTNVTVENDMSTCHVPLSPFLCFILLLTPPFLSLCICLLACLPLCHSAWLSVCMYLPVCPSTLSLPLFPFCECVFLPA